MNAWTKKAVKYIDDRMTLTKWHVYASHASFYVIVSAIPMLMLILMILGKMIPGEIDQLVTALKTHLPEQVAAYLPEDFVRNAISATLPLVSVTALLMVWSASKGMRALAGGIRSIYGGNSSSSYVKEYLFSLVYTVVFLVMILLTLLVLVFGETILQATRILDGNYQGAVSAITKFGWLFAFFMFIGVFLLMYRFMAGEKHSYKKHLPGAVFASSGWILYSAVISLYLQWFSPEKYLLYGSLGALLILMLWVHSCMTLVMWGGELNMLLMKRPLLVAGGKIRRKK